MARSGQTIVGERSSAFAGSAHFGAQQRKSCRIGPKWPELGPEASIGSGAHARKRRRQGRNLTHQPARMRASGRAEPTDQLKSDSFPNWAKDPDKGWCKDAEQALEKDSENGGQKTLARGNPRFARGVGVTRNRIAQGQLRGIESNQLSGTRPSP